MARSDALDVLLFFHYSRKTYCCPERAESWTKTRAIRHFKQPALQVMLKNRAGVPAAQRRESGIDLDGINNDFDLDAIIGNHLADRVELRTHHALHHLSLALGHAGHLRFHLC